MSDIKTPEKRNSMVCSFIISVYHSSLCQMGTDLPMVED